MTAAGGVMERELPPLWPAGPIAAKTPWPAGHNS